MDTFSRPQTAALKRSALLRYVLPLAGLVALAAHAASAANLL
jgi:hypothetical protein